MRTVAIISKPQKPELASLLSELSTWLRAHDYEPIIDPVSGNYTQSARIVPRYQMPAENPELVVVLGGDGTLLAAARAFARSDTPILSVNLGSLGFLTEVRLSDLYTTLAGWREGCCNIDHRAMLHGEILRDGQLYREFEALNDVVVAKGAIARMGDFKVHLNDQVAASFRADGVIVATPTGSTAYNLAANGPILSPDVDAMVIAPICPHLLTLRPLVVRGDAHIRISIEGIPDQTFLTVDGQEAVQVRVGDEMHCHKSLHQLRLIRIGEVGFFNVLRQKLKWGER